MHDALLLPAEGVEMRERRGVKIRRMNRGCRRAVAVRLMAARTTREHTRRRLHHGGHRLHGGRRYLDLVHRFVTAVCRRRLARWGRRLPLDLVFITGGLL